MPPIKLRASSIRTLKACPRKFQLAVLEGLAPAQETDSLRIGTIWHAMHEVYYRAWLKARHAEDEPDRVTHADPGDIAQVAALDYLNEKYTQIPHFKTPEEWALERTIISTCFVGYLWYFSEDPIDVLQSEFHWALPLHNPVSGRAVPRGHVIREGTVDHLIRWRDMVGTVERKSTSKDIAPGSAYWNPMTKDTQVSMYALALRDMLAAGVNGLRGFGIVEEAVKALEDGKSFGNTLYDVWRRPTIKPSTLTQAATAEFFSTATYYDQAFMLGVNCSTVNGVTAEVEVGKSGKPAIKETLEMFAARLLNDITERPDYYFQRREITRTAAELQQFRCELYSLYQAIKSASKMNSWYENEQQCQATYPCPFMKLCYAQGGVGQYLDGTTPLPAEFVRTPKETQ